MWRDGKKNEVKEYLKTSVNFDIILSININISQIYLYTLMARIIMNILVDWNYWGKFHKDLGTSKM